MIDTTLPGATTETEPPAYAPATYLLATWMAVIPLIRFGLNAAVAKSVYAEDGAVFFTDALRGPTALFGSYAGYGHLIPRVIAQVGALLPVAWFPWVVVAGCTALTFAAGVLLGRAADRLAMTGVARVLFVFTPVLLPALGLQIILNLANFQWIALYVAAAIVLAPSAKWPELVATFVIVATSLGALFVLPLLILRRSNDAARLAVAGVLGVGYHLVCRAIGPDSILNPYPRHAKVWAGLPRAALEAMGVANAEIGTRTKQTVLLALCIAAFVYLAARLPLPRVERTTIVGVIGAAALLMLATSALTGEASSRYAYGAVAVMLGAGWTVFRQRNVHPALLVLAAALVGAWAMSPWLLPWRADQPSWTESVDMARRQCAAAEQPDASVEVFPRNGWPPARVPCGRLRS